MKWDLGLIIFVLCCMTGVGLAAPTTDPSPALDTVPTVRVGHSNADILGTDNRALQAAVEYISRLGGGVVEIGPGEYRMADSLHLRSFITVRGTPGKTVLRKDDGAASPLAVDGDYGEYQITLAHPEGFAVGGGVSVWDKNAHGFHVTVARITGRRGNTFTIDHSLLSDCVTADGGQAATVFPIVSACDVEGVRIEDLTIEGNRERNVLMDGCRGGGIYLYRAPRATITRCRIQNYNGDGISFQQSDDVTVTDCVSEHNANLGLHPGSGSQRPTVRNCVARNNGADGLFLCWRVRHGLFEDNLLEGNGRYGISIGHKDTDNLLRRNRVLANHEDGVYFRNEPESLAGSRNRLLDNLIENNGIDHDVSGIRVRGQTEKGDTAPYVETEKGDTAPYVETEKGNTAPYVEPKRGTLHLMLEPKRGTLHLMLNRTEKGDTAPNRKNRKGGHCIMASKPKRGTLHLPLHPARRLATLPAMPRRGRRVVGDGIYHVLNRGNCRMDLFEKTGDFAAFVKLLEQGRQRTGMRVLGYCLMHNHWHLVLWPRRGPDLSRFMGWVGTTHVRRWREHRSDRGEGHLYQGRFKDFLVKDDEHLLAVLRYVEANPVRAGMVRRAEQWPWSSLGGRAGADGLSVRLEAWPVPRPRDWPGRVNRPLPDDHLDRLRTSIKRGRPFGDDKWVAATAAKLGLLSTLRDPWRPARRDKRGTPPEQK